MSEQSRFFSVAGRQLIEAWRKQHAQIIECADSNDWRGDMNASRQLHAQAFGVNECIKDLEGLLRANHETESESGKREGGNGSRVLFWFCFAALLWVVGWVVLYITVSGASIELAVLFGVVALISSTICVMIANHLFNQ